MGQTWDYSFKWQEKKLTSAQHRLQLARNAKNRDNARKKAKKVRLSHSTHNTMNWLSFTTS